MLARLNNVLAVTTLSAIGIVPISVVGVVVSSQVASAQVVQQPTLSTAKRPSDFSIAIARLLRNLNAENPIGHDPDPSPAKGAHSDDSARPEIMLIDPPVAAPPMVLSLTDLHIQIDASQSNDDPMYLSFNRDEPLEIDQNPPEAPLTLSEPESKPVTDSAISEASLDF